jgi:integrase
MARPRSLDPKYCVDKTLNRAYVRLSGHKHYLPGAIDGRKSKDEYKRLIGRWIDSGRAPLPRIDPHAAGEALTVSTLINEWRKWARAWYGATATIDGKRPAGEYGNYWDVLRELRRLHGNTPAAKFTSLALEAFAAELARDRAFVDPITGQTVTRKGMCRNVINRHMSRIKRVFKWGAKQEPPFVPGEAYHRLTTAEGIQMGRGQARETEEVQPVPEKDVIAVLSHLPEMVKAMVELQFLTAMHPGEICGMRWMEIDTTAHPFEYRPAKHKTAHKGKKRIIELGPPMLEILAQFLAARLNPTAYIFSPARAEADRNEKRRAERKTPMTPLQLRRAEIAATRQRQRPLCEKYDVTAYRRAIERACEKAFDMSMEFLPNRKDPAEQKKERAAKRQAWHAKNKFRPNQLRHGGATKTRRLHGLDAAQQQLGHASRRMTERYARPDFDLARRVAMESKRLAAADE